MDHHHADSPSGQIRAASSHAGRNVDLLAGVACLLGMLALVAWSIAGLAVQLDHRNDRSTSAGLLATVLASTITICAAACAVGAANRRYARALIDHDLAVLYRKLDRMAGPPPAPAGGANVLQPAAADEWRAYLAGRLDRDDPR